MTNFMIFFCVFISNNLHVTPAVGVADNFSTIHNVLDEIQINNDI